MTFKESIAVCLVEKYADIDGRASRSEYWWFYLFTMLVTRGAELGASGLIGGTTGLVLSLIVAVALITPSIVVGVRRLHDIGKSGWHLLWSVTLIGIIPVIVWLCTEGSKDPNKYGDPIDLSN